MHSANVSAGHAERTLVRLENDLLPFVGAKPLAEIEAPELPGALRRIEARGVNETAYRAKDACGQVFRCAMAAGCCTRNPAADLREALKPVATRHHAAVVDPKGVGARLRAVMHYPRQPPTRAALMLSALLMLRPCELRQIEWAWVGFEASMLTIPGDLMKRKKADKASGARHLVPLAPQAVAILQEDVPTNAPPIELLSAMGPCALATCLDR